MREQPPVLLTAPDAAGLVLDLLVQKRRNQEAAESFLRRVLSGHPDEQRLVATDKLACHAPVIKKVLPRAGCRTHKGLNNWAERGPLSGAATGAARCSRRQIP